MHCSPLGPSMTLCFLVIHLVHASDHNKGKEPQPSNYDWKHKAGKTAQAVGKVAVNAAPTLPRTVVGMVSGTFGAEQIYDDNQQGMRQSFQSMQSGASEAAYYAQNMARSSQSKKKKD